MPLDVALSEVVPADVVMGAFSVHVTVRGGQAPVRIYLYFDGDLVGTWDDDDLAGAYEFSAPAAQAGRHALTVRAIDAAGRWGGSSRVVKIAEPVVLSLRA